MKTKRMEDKIDRQMEAAAKQAALQHLNSSDGGKRKTVSKYWWDRYGYQWMAKTHKLEVSSLPVVIVLVVGKQT